MTLDDPPPLTAAQYREAFARLREEAKPYQLRPLELHRASPGGTATMTQLADALGYRSYHGVNLIYGQFAALLCDRLGLSAEDRPDPGTAVLATFEKPDGDAAQWRLTLRPEVVRALDDLGWFAAGGDDWPSVWSRLRSELTARPRCPEHPGHPAVRTLRDQSVNDVLEVNAAGVTVRSHKTGREDVLPEATFRAWWEALNADGTAGLDPATAPRGDRAVLVGAILARCLPDRIGVDGDRLVLLNPAAPSRSERQVREELDEGVRAAASLSPDELAAALAAAAARPARNAVTVTAFLRSPHVIAATLRRAGGVCEDCGEPAPFLRASDGSPYLEVHHRVRLADGGEDTLDNAAALCPNCHRRAHHG